MDNGEGGRGEEDPRETTECKQVKRRLGEGEGVLCGVL